MAINKVVYGNNTLVDLTGDTVEANNLLEGETAHDKSGNPVTGTAKQGHIVQDNNGTDLTQRGTIQFKGVTVTDDATNGKTVVEATKTTVGLGNVPNVTTDNQTPTVTEASTRSNIASGDNLKTIIGKIKKWFTDLKDLAFIAKDGTSSTKYLRGDGTWQAFSKSTVGLGNVDNTSDADKPISTAQQTALDAKVNKAGDTMTGVLTIDSAGGTTSSVGNSRLNIGNTTPSGTAGNSSGFIFLYGNSGKYARLDAMNVTANRNISLPNAAGTIALTSDVAFTAVMPTFNTTIINVNTLTGFTLKLGKYLLINYRFSVNW